MHPTIGLVIIVALVLLGIALSALWYAIMALDDRTDTLIDCGQVVNKRLADLEERLAGLYPRLAAVEEKLSGVRCALTGQGK